MTAIERRLIVALVAIVTILTGLLMLGSGRPDPDAQAAVSAELLAVIRLERTRKDSLDRRADSIGRRADRLTARYAALRDDTRARFQLDSAGALPAPATTPAAADTTEMFGLVRASDRRVFPVPLEFIRTVRSEQLAADSAIAAERDARQYLKTVVLPQRDSLIGRLEQLDSSRVKEITFWRRRANPRCGTKCKLIAGAVAGEGLRRMVSGWLR